MMQLGTVWMMLQSQNKIIFLVAVVLQPSIETIVLVSIWWLKLKCIADLQTCTPILSPRVALGPLAFKVTL